MSAGIPDPAESQFLQGLRELSESAARAGGKLARASFGERQVVTLKADGSEVTEIDVAAEREIVALIRSQRPNDTFIGEEAVGRRHEATGVGRASRPPVEHGRDARATPRSDEGELGSADFGLRKDEDEALPDRGNPQSPIPNPQSPIPNPQSAIRNPQSLCWVIDPLDGTRNYVRGLPIFTCSVAALRGGEPVAGAVYDPIQNVMYSAAHGQGMQVDGRRVSLANAAADNANAPKTDLLVGIPSAQRRTTRHFVLHAVERHVVRNLGSAALHLALVATGQLDVAVLSNSRLWDVAAGWLLVTEAGGLVTSPDGSALFPLDVSQYAGEEMPVLAGNPAAHARLTQECRTC